MKKVYVAVNADFSDDGRISPLSFVWEDGRKFEVDRILDTRPMASLKAGGFGTRYTIRVLGKETYMWLEDSGNKWFMEGKN
jgi:hypothetical protein